MSSNLFNVPEPTGAEQVKFETTAAEAEINAPNDVVAQEVAENAEIAQEVAADAAAAAQHKGSALTGQTSALDQFQQQAKATTDTAVAQGQESVESAKVASAGYVDSVKALAGSALATAQAYLPASLSGSTQTGTGTNTSTTGVVSSIQAGAVSAVGTAGEYLAGAQAALQPHVDNAKATIQPHIDAALGTAQPHIDNAKATVQPHIDNARSTAQPYYESARDAAQPHYQNAKAAIQPHVDSTIAAAQPHIDRAKASVQSHSPLKETPASSTGIPATTAPLESGGTSVDTPYPSTTGTLGSGVRVAENETF